MTSKTKRNVGGLLRESLEQAVAIEAGRFTLTSTGRAHRPGIDPNAMTRLFTTVAATRPLPTPDCRHA